MLLGVLAVTLTYSSYVAEVIRAGIDAVHPSQRLAARALGLGYGQTLRRIVLPQALRKMTPPLMNDFVSMQKDVGLISILGAIDAIGRINANECVLCLRCQVIMNDGTQCPVLKRRVRSEAA